MGDGTPVAQDLRPVIFVTGFGPFPCHPTNASQLAVESLCNYGIEEELGVRLVTEVFQVEYDYVKKTIPQRWKDLKPKLTVHLGVSGMAEALTLEQLAHNTGYKRQDNCGSVPESGVCCPAGDEIIQSSIRMDLISSTLNKATHLKLPCAKSTDPGRFLCDFIYYMSLMEDKSRSAFIHVPCLTKFTVEEISAAVAGAIKEMYLQVLEMDNKKDKEDPNGELVTDEECQNKGVKEEELALAV